MASNRLYSFIMAAYNAEKYINAAIESVIAQTYKNWELYIVDDGSSDNTFAIADEYGSRDNRINILKTKHLGNAGLVRNIAIEHIKGDYVQSLDSDDWISEDYLEKCDEVLSKNSNLDIIIPISLKINSLGEVIHRWMPINDDYEAVLSNTEGFYYSLDWQIHGWIFINSNLLKKIRYEGGVINSDEFTTRKLLYNANLIGFSRAVYYYRDNEMSTTRNKINSARMYEWMLTCRNIYDYAVDNNMPQSCILKQAKILLRALWNFQTDYSKNKAAFSEKERKSIERILQSIYKGISLKTILESRSSRGLFVLFSFHSYRLYSVYASVIK